MITNAILQTSANLLPWVRPRVRPFSFFELFCMIIVIAFLPGYTQAWRTHVLNDSITVRFLPNSIGRDTCVFRGVSSPVRFHAQCFIAYHTRLISISTWFGVISYVFFSFDRLRNLFPKQARRMERSALCGPSRRHRASVTTERNINWQVVLPSKGSGWRCKGCERLQRTPMYYNYILYQWHRTGGDFEVTNVYCAHWHHRMIIPKDVL